MSRSRKLAAGKVKRAEIVLLSDKGKSRKEISATLGVCQHTASRLIIRFNQFGLAGLEEGPRTGRPKVYAPNGIGVVIQTALTNPRDLNLAFASWTLDRLVTYLNEEKQIMIKRGRISQIFRHEGLRWRKQEGWFGEKVDPDFSEKRGALKPSTPNHPTTAA